MKKFLIAAVALSVLASAGAASAQSYGAPQAPAPRHDNRGDHRNDGQNRGGPQGGYDQRGGNGYNDRSDRRDDRRDGRYDNRYERRAERSYNGGRYTPPRGHYSDRRWRRGEYLPGAYRDRGYAVDYRAYRLPPPPYGYGYYRSGDDVVLTAIATGLIASVVFNLFN